LYFYHTTPRKAAKKQPYKQGEMAHIGQLKQTEENPMNLNIENQKWTVNQTKRGFFARKKIIKVK
tara:strand:+ start:781 stop:975 length:195 start_codon:yes stop_codon:yes gene_type:complete